MRGQVNYRPGQSIVSQSCAAATDITIEFGDEIGAQQVGDALAMFKTKLGGVIDDLEGFLHIGNDGAPHTLETMTALWLLMADFEPWRCLLVVLFDRLVSQEQPKSPSMRQPQPPPQLA